MVFLNSMRVFADSQICLSRPDCPESLGPIGGPSRASLQRFHKLCQLLGKLLREYRLLGLDHDYNAVYGTSCGDALGIMNH
jgi:hypothetical protein